MNVFWPKFAEADFSTNLRNTQLVDFFLLHLCCLLDDLKGQYRQKNSAVVCWFLPYFNEKGNCNAAKRTATLQLDIKCSRPCVDKDFFHSGSMGHIGQARALCYEKHLNIMTIIPSVIF